MKIIIAKDARRGYIPRNKQRKKGKKGGQFVCHGICRDCGNEQPTLASDFTHASPPRCYACGGMLDKKWY
jgi:ribosomal protein S27E